MELNIRIEITSPRWLRRALLLGLPVGAMAITSVAVGAPPKVFVANTPLLAADLNTNFSDLDTRLVELEAGRSISTVNGHAFSLGSTEFCGATAQTYLGGSIGGLAGAKSLCEGRCSSPSAHICSIDEVRRLAQQSAPPTIGGWIAGATGDTYSVPNDDCVGWTVSGSAGNDHRGTVWDANQKLVGQSYCWQSPNPVVCCD